MTKAILLKTAADIQGRRWSDIQIALHRKAIYRIARERWYRDYMCRMVRDSGARLR